MKSQIEDKTQLLFNETAHLTSVTEYGISWGELTSGRVEPPLQGARFDIAFEGSFEGPEFAGTIKGIDYLTVRADGRFMMDIFATITTDDGERIPLREQGPVIPRENGLAQLQLTLNFITNSAKYSWLNKIQVWGIGQVDINTGKIKVQAFTGDRKHLAEAV